MATLNLTLAAGTDDAAEAQDGTGFTHVAATVTISASATIGTRTVGGFHFPAVAIPAGATIDTAVLSVWCSSATFDNPRCDLHCEDIDDSPDFNTNGDVIDRVRTTASVPFIATGISTAAYTAADDIAAVVQEVIDRVGWASGGGITVLAVGRDDLSSFLTVVSYDTDPAKAAKLDITYTEPGGGALIEGKLVGRGILGGRLVA